MTKGNHQYQFEHPKPNDSRESLETDPISIDSQASQGIHSAIPPESIYPPNYHINMNQQNPSPAPSPFPGSKSGNSVLSQSQYPMKYESSQQLGGHPQQTYQPSSDQFQNQQVSSQLLRPQLASSRVCHNDKIDLHNDEMELDYHIEIKRLADSNDNIDFTISNLLLTHNYFLGKAHKLVLLSNDTTGTKMYFKMIKLSIKALLIIIKQYNQCLNPYLELIVYYKLAKLYLHETENINRADDYINKAISVSSRNSLIGIKFISEFLAGQILVKSNSRLLINYLNDRIQSYKQQNLLEFSHLFTLMKVNNLLVSDCTTGLIVLQTLGRDPALSNLTKIICLLFETNLHLYRGSPHFAKSCLDQIEFKNSSYAPQLVAMHKLLSFQYFIQINSIQESKRLLKELSDFINDQRQSSWNNWNENGYFKIENSSNGVNVPYQILWLNSDEFVIMVYFLTGLHFLNDMSLNYKKATRIFKACLDIITNQLKELTNIKKSKRNFPIYQLTNKIIRLNYTRFLIDYYQVWLKLTNNELDNVTELDEFITNYNNDGFTNEELCYYKLLVPKIFHLHAIHCQYVGDIKAAKYYFFKVKLLTSSALNVPITPQNSLITSLQLSLGIGGGTVEPKNEFNELYIFSNLHLLMISSFELNKLSLESQNNNDSISKCHTFITKLYFDLTKAFNNEGKLTSNSFTMNFTNSNHALLLTYQTILAILMNNGFSNMSEKIINDSLNNSLITLLKSTQIPQGMTFIKSLSLFVIYLSSLNVNEREKYFNQFNAHVFQSNDNDQIVKLMILRELRAKNMRSDNLDQVKMNDLEIQVLNEKVRQKFLLANIL